MKRLHAASPLRIFAISGLVTVAGLLAVLIGMGPAALLVTVVLVIIEVVFSFDNAIVNAKILERLTSRWQNAFLTIGIIIAIFGMRLLFPLIIVGLAAHLSLGTVWQMALNKPHEYADKLMAAHPLIAAFGGAFLLLLALEFFLNDGHETVWWQSVEHRLQRLGRFWLPAVITVIVVLILAAFSSRHGGQILRAGLLGAAVFVIIRLVTAWLERGQPHGRQLTGWAAFALFMYLEVLDASFSFDGVIGAFAITDVVVLIAAGLGIGALWVRSLTIFMVRRGTLGQYKYLEHGAYYTIFVLAVALLASLFINIPDIITGIIGLGIIAGALYASIQARRRPVEGKPNHG